MSGTRHEAFVDSKSVSVDKNRIVSQTNEQTNYTMSVKEVPLISYNDMASIAPCNSMVFRIGDNPIWNRNQMALPMSHCIHSNQINVSGKKFTLLTVPTTSSALEFDLTAMVPDFDAMLEQRLSEFETIDDAKEVYKMKTHLTDAQINHMDADVYASEIMAIANELLAERKREAEEKGKAMENNLKMTDNEDLKDVVAEEEAKHEEGRKARYAGGKLSREDIVKSGCGYNDIFYDAFMETRDGWKRNPNVAFTNDGVKSKDGRLLIDFNNQALKEFGDELAKASQEDKTKVFAEDADAPNVQAVDIRPEFITWLCELESWPRAFDDAVAKRIQE
jgi:hypothetical protein